MSPGALTIGAAARLARVPAWKLRAWESAGLLDPERSSAGYRIYAQGDLERIRYLKRHLDSAGRLGLHALRVGGQPQGVIGEAEGGESLLPPSPPAPLTEILEWTGTASGAAWAILVRPREGDKRVTVAAVQGRPPLSKAILSRADSELIAAHLRGGETIEEVELADFDGPVLVVRIEVADGALAALLVDPRADRARLAESIVPTALLLREMRSGTPSSVRADRAGRGIDAVYAVMHAQRATAEVHRSAEVALEHLLDVIGWDAAAVHVINRAGQRFERVAEVGCSKEFLDAISGWGLGQGLGGRALLAAEPIIAPEFATDERVQPNLRSLYGAWAGVPLITFGRKVGLLEMMSEHPRDLPGEDLEYVQMLGGLIATAISDSLSRETLAEAEQERDRLVRGWADQLAVAEADQEQLLERILDSAVAAPLKAAIRQARSGDSPQVLETAAETAVTAVGAIGRSAAGRTGTTELLRTLLEDGLAATVASLPGSFELEVDEWPARLSVAAATQLYDLVRTVTLDYLRERGASSVVLSMFGDNTGIDVKFRTSWTVVPMEVAPNPEAGRRIKRLIADLDARSETLRRGRVEHFSLQVPVAPNTAHLSLTARQAEIIEALSRGLTRREVALFLGISEKTVQNHLSSAYKRLDARNRSQAIANAISARLIPPP